MTPPEDTERIIIGDNSPGVGDHLLLTAVAREVKLAHPARPVEVQVSSLDELFWHNPYVDRLVITDTPYITQNIGIGRLVERKCRSYGVAPRSALPQVFITAAEREQARQLLHEFSDRPLVTLGLECAPRWKHAGFWAAELWQRVITELRNEVHFVRLGRSENLAPLASAPLTLLDLPLRQAAAIYGCAALHLGRDTGAMHLALACGTRCIAIVPESSEDYAWDRWHYPTGVSYIPCDAGPHKVAEVVRGLLTRQGFSTGRPAARLPRPPRRMLTPLTEVSRLAELLLGRIQARHENTVTALSFAPSATFEANLLQLLDENYSIWHLAEELQRTNVPDEIASLQRAVAKANQTRNHLMDCLDESLVDLLRTPGAPVACARPGPVCDRLTVLSLEIYHMREEARRATAGVADRARCLASLERLTEQFRDLAGSAARLLAEFEAGICAFKPTYRFRVYDDQQIEMANQGGFNGRPD